MAMPDHELSLIILAHVLKNYVQQKLDFLTHSKLPLETVLADFASALSSYENVFGCISHTTALDALSLVQIIGESSLKTSFTIESENAGELVLLGPVKQAQATLLNVVVESSIKYGITLIGQLQGLKDEYHSLSLEEESTGEPSKPVTAMVEKSQTLESEEHQISVTTTLDGVKKTEISPESRPVENDAMEVDMQNPEQDSVDIEETLKEPENSGDNAEEVKPEVNDQTEADTNKDEENPEEPEKFEADELESASTEEQEPKDSITEPLPLEEPLAKVQDTENDPQDKKPEIEEGAGAEYTSINDDDEDLVSDEIERSSRLLLEESERDQEEMQQIEKPKLADVDIETEAEKLDQGEENEENQEDEVVEEQVSKTEPELILPNDSNIPEFVISEPVSDQREHNSVEEQTKEQAKEKFEKPINEDKTEMEAQENPQENPKPSTSSRRKRKADEALEEAIEPETPKKPRKAKEVSSTIRRKNATSEQSLTPAQKYKRFQNIAINLIKSIEAHRFSSPFLTAVTAPEYTLVVKHPQDLKSIMKNIRKRHDLAVYTTVKELERDIMLMFANCVMFNKSSMPLVKIAQEMKNDVRNTFKMFEDTESGIA